MGATRAGAVDWKLVDAVRSGGREAYVRARPVAAVVAVVVAAAIALAWFRWANGPSVGVAAVTAPPPPSEAASPAGPSSPPSEEPSATLVATSSASPVPSPSGRLEAGAHVSGSFADPFTYATPGG